jgi:hypothetical protein
VRKLLIQKLKKIKANFKGKALVGKLAKAMPPRFLKLKQANNKIKVMRDILSSNKLRRHFAHLSINNFLLIRISHIF